MSFRAVVLNVLIASPGDAGEARDTVERAIRGWNSDRAREVKVMLLSLRWETDAVPSLRAPVQSIINNQLVDEADIVFGLFDTRLGTPTRGSVSGTAEEIERSSARGAQVHVYFSDMEIRRPTNVEEFTEQYASLDKFKKLLQKHAFVGSYRSYEHLAAQVRTALELDVNKLIKIENCSGSTGQRTSSNAILRVSYEYEDRSSTESMEADSVMHMAHSRIEVENVGISAADNVCCSVKSVSQGGPPIEGFDTTESRRIAPFSKISFPIYSAIGTAAWWEVTISWEEGGKFYSERHIVGT